MTLNDNTLPIGEIVEFFTRAKKNNITSKYLAKKSGFSCVTLSHWKTGKTTPRLLDFSMLVKALEEKEEELKNNK